MFLRDGCSTESADVDVVGGVSDSVGGSGGLDFEAGGGVGGFVEAEAVVDEDEVKGDKGGNSRNLRESRRDIGILRVC